MAVTGRSEFAAALNQVAHERGLDPLEVLDTMKVAILAAYRRDYGPIDEPELAEGEEPNEADIIDVAIDPESGEIKLVKGKEDVTPAGFGRIAAQTAKQVLLQRIREAEKDAILMDYSQKIGTIISGMIQRQQGPAWIVDIGRAEAVLPPREQSPGEYYRLNQRLKFYITEIRERDKRSEIIVSRSHPDLVVGLFKQEVPEISAGSVVIKAIAREAGYRTKIAVVSTQVGVDPVGSCVGQKGNRIQTVINELNGEKIDVIPYSEEPPKFIAQALQPAQNATIRLNEAEKTAVVIVPDADLSLAIGSKGQNVRLAAKLSGYHLEIIGREQLAQQEAATTEATEKAEGTEEIKPETLDQAAEPIADETTQETPTEGAADATGKKAKPKTKKATKKRATKKPATTETTE